MTKAEERALEAYPDMTFPFTPLDLNAYRRGAFIQGYEAAEKDLSLTAEDIGIIFRKVRAEGVKWSATEGCYPDVAKWFNEYKKNGKD